MEAKRKKREEMSNFTFDAETENASDVSHAHARNTSLQESLTGVSPYTKVIGKRMIGSGSFGKFATLFVYFLLPREFLGSSEFGCLLGKLAVKKIKF